MTDHAKVTAGCHRRNSNGVQVHRRAHGSVSRLGGCGAHAASGRVRERMTVAATSLSSRAKQDDSRKRIVLWSEVVESRLINSTQAVVI